MPKRRGRPPHDDVLTPAEWKTVHAVQHGMSNAQIAERRGVSKDAVKFHVANATGKLGVAGRQGLKGWFAAPAGSALKAGGPDMATDRQGAAPEAEHGPHLGQIGQVSRTVGDIAGAEAFYRDVLGLRHLYTFGDLSFFDCGGVRLYLQRTDKPSPDESCIYFRVTDIVATHAELVRRGAKFRGAPHMIHRHADGTEEWMAFLDDPDGRPLAIMAQVKAG